jgi:glycosyltransferase involved in cell wall biosynthesis
VVKKKTISVCIPVFNEEDNVVRAVAAVEAVFAERLPGYDLEIVITDNASTDRTWQVVGELALTRPNLKAFRFSRNFGYQNSIFAGLSLAIGDAIVELDADLEDPPEIIARFVEKWEEGVQVVYGVRARRYGSRVIRSLTHVFYRVLNRMSEHEIPEDSGDFRLLDRRVVTALAGLPERNLYLRGLVSFLGFRQAPVVYERNPRLSGPSKFRFLNYVVLALDAITAFSKTPLRLISVFGVVLFVSSLGLAAYYLILYLRGGIPVPGFTTLAILVLALHGATFIFLGVLGEYMSRIFDDAKNRPRVIIAEAINATEHPDSL